MSSYLIRVRHARIHQHAMLLLHQMFDHDRSIRNIHRIASPGKRRALTSRPFARRFSTNFAHCVDFPARSNPSNTTSFPRDVFDMLVLVAAAGAKYHAHTFNRRVRVAVCTFSTLAFCSELLRRVSITHEPRQSTPPRCPQG